MVYLDKIDHHVVFEPSETRAMQVTIHTMGSLSMIAALSVVGSFIYRGTWRDAGTRIVMWLAIADFFGCLGFFFGRLLVDSPFFCSAQGVLIQWGALAGVIWTGALATNIFIAVARRRMNIVDFKRAEPYYHIIAWGVPAAVAGLLFLAQKPEKGPVYAKNTLWCHFSTPYDAFRMSAFYGPIWVVFGWNAIAYVTVGYRLYHSQRSVSNIEESPHSDTSEARTQRALTRYIRKTSLYLVVFFLNWSFSTINRLENIILPEKPLFALYYLHSVSL
ncbi:hypothetical protein HK104_006363 [Borealophlyctis nickersoniae]|nr:hypothetical protein HK104_006363 [Borealophlyctis nickersoniae]